MLLITNDIPDVCFLNMSKYLSVIPPTCFSSTEEKYVDKYVDVYHVYISSVYI